MAPVADYSTQIGMRKKPEVDKFKKDEVLKNYYLPGFMNTSKYSLINPIKIID